MFLSTKNTLVGVVTPEFDPSTNTLACSHIATVFNTTVSKLYFDGPLFPISVPFGVFDKFCPPKTRWLGLLTLEFYPSLNMLSRQSHNNTL